MVLTLSPMFVCYYLFTDDSERGIERCTLLLTLTVLIVHSPPEVANVRSLVTPCTHIYKHTWEAQHPGVSQYKISGKVC